MINCAIDDTSRQYGHAHGTSARTESPRPATQQGTALPFGAQVTSGAVVDAVPAMAKRIATGIRSRGAPG